MDKLDRFYYERDLLERGVEPVAGVDEAGRGPLAGPVMAAAVILPRHWIAGGMPEALAGLNDSKQLSEASRNQYFELLTGEAGVCQAVAEESSEAIDRWNILQATHRAMNRALQALSTRPAHVLVDGLRVKTLCLPQTPLVKGDSRSYSIAAASVIAKVTRDRLMLHYDKLYPQYGFAEHKGYATPQHLEALSRWGPCPLHRRSFAPLKPSQPDMFP
ncbi:MAG TPA: ribonuclease HII [Candidatus Paceibacterota bacterium]|nr:ribonuclease HII [Verrucomicrobiota bacterium]HRY52087.1 ribonuclease HII [Candidatus Paceibacterota bacterium]HSA02115.1 ribonuclease HII [Candidatus Paceibacterota bacterium]